MPRCNLCHKDYVNAKTLQAHAKRVHERVVELLFCQCCSEGFTDNDRLVAHLATSHPTHTFIRRRSLLNDVFREYTIFIPECTTIDEFETLFKPYLKQFLQKVLSLQPSVYFACVLQAIFSARLPEQNQRDLLELPLRLQRHRLSSVEVFDQETFDEFYSHMISAFRQRLQDIELSGSNFSLVCFGNINIEVFSKFDLDSILTGGRAHSIPKSYILNGVEDVLPNAHNQTYWCSIWCIIRALKPELERSQLAFVRAKTALFPHEPPAAKEPISFGMLRKWFLKCSSNLKSILILYAVDSDGDLTPIARIGYFENDDQTKIIRILLIRANISSLQEGGGGGNKYLKSHDRQNFNAKFFHCLLIKGICIYIYGSCNIYSS